MPNTTPSNQTCPVCDRPHANLSSTGRRTLSRIGLSDLEIENITNQGDTLAAIPAPSRHRTISGRDRAAMMLQLGVPASDIDAIATQAQSRYESPDIEPLSLDAIDMLPDEFIDPEGEAFIAAADAFNALVTKTDNTDRQRRLNRERQARFRAKRVKQDHNSNA